jgi:HSP20 family protein
MMTMYISPYRRMNRMREAVNRLFEENFPDNETGEREMLLAVDVIAQDDAYEIQAMVPGLEAEDINVEIINNTVTIRGEFDSGEEEAKFLACELPSGRFSRVITLPTDLDATKAEASLSNGIFTLRVPKAEAHRPKVIKVQAG